MTSCPLNRAQTLSNTPLFKKKSLPQSGEEDGNLTLFLGTGQAWRAHGPGQALPLNDKLDAVAGL